MRTTLERVMQNYLIYLGSLSNRYTVHEPAIQDESIFAMKKISNLQIEVPEAIFSDDDSYDRSSYHEQNLDFPIQQVLSDHPSSLQKDSKLSPVESLRVTKNQQSSDLFKQMQGSQGSNNYKPELSEDMSSLASNEEFYIRDEGTQPTNI